MKYRRTIMPSSLATSFPVLGLALALALAACESPEPPAPCNPLPGHTITVGQTATATACFDDPNQADTLTYTASSSDPSVATAAIAGTVVTVTAVHPGLATITVTATDPEGLQGHARFTITVPNRPPMTHGSLDPVTAEVGTAVTIDVSGNFSEPDGQTLTYSGASSDPAVATVTVNQSVIIVNSLAHGTTTITITATDPGGLSASLAFTVTVPNRGPEAQGTIPDVTIEAGTTQTVDVSSYFSDPDGDLLTYTATTSDPAVAAVAAVHEAVIISSLARGTSDLTVTVTDPGGLSATQSFAVTVPNRPPETRGTIPAVSVHVGDTLVLDMSAYFSDPDGDTLTYAPATTDHTITTTSAGGAMISVAATARGTGTVSVTVTDPAGLSASQSFRVNIPNRPPRTGPRLPDVEVIVGYPAELNVAPHFSDPDGDTLTYSASSSDAGVATASAAGNSVTVTPVAPGSATLTVTATDPEGEEVSQSAVITVQPRDPGYFADDFATNASLANWTVSRANARVRDGVLHLTNSRGNRQGQARRDHPLTEWSITTRLGRTDTDASAALVMFMNHDRYTHYIVQIGSGVEVDGNDTNYRGLLYDAEEDTYLYPPGMQGKTNLIRDGSGEFTDITFSLIRRQLVLQAGTTRLFRSFPLNSSLPVEITGYALVPWPHEEKAGRTVLFDWFEMDGDLVGSAVQGRRAGDGGRIPPPLPVMDPERVKVREVRGLRARPRG